MLKVLISLLMIGGIGTGYIGFTGGDATLGMTGAVVAVIFAVILVILFIKAIGCIFTIIAIVLVLLAVAWFGGFVELPGSTGKVDVSAVKIDDTQKERGFWDNLVKNSMEEPEKEGEEKPQPKINGIAKVVSGDTLKIANKEIKMYGVEAPRLDQVCVDKFNRSYYCGNTATEKLAMMIGHRPVECTIIGNKGNNTYGVCITGNDDIGAYMVGLGYAFPNPEFGQVYIPYETNARTKKLGLWEGGQFYAPWQWDVVKAKGGESKVHIVEPVKKKENTGGTIWSQMFK